MSLQRASLLELELECSLLDALHTYQVRNDFCVVHFASTNYNHEIIASESRLFQGDTCFDTVACGDPFWDGAGSLFFSRFGSVLRSLSIAEGWTYQGGPVMALRILRIWFYWDGVLNFNAHEEAKDEITCIRFFLPCMELEWRKIRNSTRAVVLESCDSRGFTKGFSFRRGFEQEPFQDFARLCFKSEGFVFCAEREVGHFAWISMQSQYLLSRHPNDVSNGITLHYNFAFSMSKETSKTLSPSRLTMRLGATSNPGSGVRYIFKSERPNR
ncbi:hypothetical protein CDAR_562521 [Caerostris darwini]|uniref:Uncharacterized protein n=1 Tax=Caerostris darwini TaxID=1538125 RepID=A0AAV4X7V4_9ARAC|nr:hypothetical protein CDAR_562521 [Caerostris darwini]